MSESLETYAAKQAITEVLYRYCHAVDRMDADLASRIWHPDGVARYEDIFEGTGSGFMAAGRPRLRCHPMHRRLQPRGRNVAS